MLLAAIKNKLSRQKKMVFKAMSTTLTIDIKTNAEMPLGSFLAAMTGLHANYKEEIIAQGVKVSKENSALSISKIETGSIIAELRPYVDYALPLLQDVNLVVGFVEQMKATYEWLLGKSEPPKRLPTRQEYSNYYAFNDMIANNSQGVNVIGNINAPVNVNVNFYVAPQQAAQVNKTIEQKISEEKETQNTHFSRVAMIWRQAQFGTPQTKTGNKVIIQDVTKNPLPCFFAHEDEQERMYALTDWQNLVHIVDIDVQYINDKPNFYRVTKVYQGEEFSPEA